MAAVARPGTIRVVPVAKEVTMPGTRNAAPLALALDAAGVGYEVLEHRRTETAAAEAEALGLPPHDVAKTIVVGSPDGNVRVVLLASDRLDMRKLRDLLGAGKEIHLLAEDDLGRAYPEFELGAVPPLGGPPGDRVIVDARVLEHPTLVLEAGTHDRSVRVGTAELVAAVGATKADVALE
jgi:Ala-tRNA(Pro) deacylase